MKKASGIAMLIVFGLGVSAFAADLSGTYVGYSWKDEAKGVTLADAVEKIETTLTLDSKGIIRSARVDFLVKSKDGSWYRRNDPAAAVSVNYAADPSPAQLRDDGKSYTPGVSMFSIKTQDMMSFYAAGVDGNGTAVLAIVEPITRYQFEVKMTKSFNYDLRVRDLTIGSGLLVPTVRTSAGGFLQVKNWEALGGRHIFSFYRDPYVLTGRGVLAGLTPDSTVRALLEKLGVQFVGGVPQPMAVRYGYTSIGGWKGNYDAVAAFLVGKDATKLTSLIDWSVPRYAGGINDQNFFGLDAKTGATRTVQNSVDGIAGATVRMSREAASYQRALVAAGILKESQVIKGRF